MAHPPPSHVVKANASEVQVALIRPRGVMVPGGVCIAFKSAHLWRVVCVIVRCAHHRLKEKLLCLRKLRLAFSVDHLSLE